MSSVFSTDEIKKVVDELKELKAVLKALEKKEEQLKQALYNHMLDNEILITPDGEILLSWKYSEPTAFFDAKRLQKENPHTYQAYMDVRDGSRRLLIK